MRIAYTHVFSWPDVWRGGERILHESTRALARRGHDVTILTSSPRPGRAMDAGVKVIRLRRDEDESVRQEARFGRKVLPRLVAGDYDVVHSLGPSDAAASVAASWMRPDRRTVYTNLGTPERAFWRQRPDWWHHSLTVRCVDVYGCMSSYAAGYLARDFGREATLIPGGVSMRDFQPGLPRSADPSLLYSGALEERRKGLPVLIAALPAIIDAEPLVRLWISGPGDADRVLRHVPERVRKHIDVLPVGRPQRRDVYARAWVTALPATYETFGIVVLESLASGTPVVGALHGALPELITPSTGALAKPEDAGSLAEACLRALELARAEDIADVCRAAAAPYDWDSGLAPRLEEIYATGG